ncbi:MAG TPA: chitobiase/beta-hexosaminidase C-terminal domain-containing protein, partial [Blastocatellia bacterium]|nr:chitobiase/beta-hexosaminidase C-terminal domain-containing protein [Blastocatellia bacterium]
LQNDFFGNPRPPAGNGTNHLDIGAIESLTTATPAFSLAGGTYHNVPPPTLTLTSSTPGAVIYYTYTTNGTTPTTSSTVYSGPITINKTGTVEAIAQAPGYAVSPISAKAYVYLVPIPAPSFSLAGGNYSTPQTLFLTDAIPGCVTNCGFTIYYTYTTGGTVPTNASTPYNPVTGITINKTGIVEAIAYPTDTANYFQSGVSNKSYTYVAALTAPTVNPGTGIFVTNANRSVTMTDPTNSALAGFAIYYTTDGSTPGTSAGGSTSLYSGTFNLNVPSASVITVKALATATGFPASAVTTRVYTFLPQLVAPNFLLAGGHVPAGSILKFAAVPAGVTIYYTTNGSAPSTASNVYNPVTGIVINGSETVRAIAVGTGFINSNPSAKAYLVP